MTAHRSMLKRRAPKAVGISVGAQLTNLSSTPRHTFLDDCLAIGLTHVRFEVSREAIELTSGVYTWTTYDPVVADITARGMIPIPMIGYTPAWARSGGTFSTPPTSTTLWANFCAACVTHYGPLGVHKWEIWNEPNITLFWGGASTSATAYYTLLSAAVTAMRAVEPSCYIISAGLSPATTAGGDTAPLDFLSSMITSGIATLGVNAVGWHPYCFPAFVSDVEPWSAWSQMIDNTTNAIGLLNAAGSNLPLWLTEFGCPTGGPGTGGTRATRLSGPAYEWMDQDCQAQLASDSVFVVRFTPRLAGLAWYTHDDYATGSIDPQDNYGLLTFAGSQKTAWGYLASALVDTQGVIS